MPPNRQRSKKKRDGGGGLAIKIKPFAKPPSLPPNFYESTVSILWTSLKCILHRRPLELPPTTTDPNSDHPPKMPLSPTPTSTTPTRNSPTATSRAHSPKTSAADPTVAADKITGVCLKPPAAHRISRSISREELFGKVQDLCSNSYGPALYRELVDVLDNSAKICVGRLVASRSIDDDDGHHAHCYPRIVYPTPNCYADSNGGVYFPTTSATAGVGGVGPDRLLLQNVWNMWNDYVQYINCVRSVFLSLDRMFVYLPNDHGTAGRAIPRSGGSGGSAGKGAASGSLQAGGGSTGAFSLWDVGMYCLWKHLVLYDDKQCGGTQDQGDMVFMDQRRHQQRRLPKYSVLEVLKARTISCLLVELDSGTDIAGISHGGDGASMILHYKPLVRNCVSMFRTLGQCTPAHATNNNINVNVNVNVNVIQDFLQDLVDAMTQYFTKESSKWMQNNLPSPSAGNCPTKTSYDARALLRHVDARLKQVHAMTVYYLLTSPSSASAASNTIQIGGAARQSSAGRNQMRSSSSHHLAQNRILTLLVEAHLLTPHFTQNHVLHPTNLYPILDDQRLEENHHKYPPQQHYYPNSKAIDDVKILFHLSKRVVRTHHKHQQEHLQNTTTTSTTGVEQLRAAFSAYVLERGASIVRPRSHHHRGSGSTAVTTNRELQSKIIPNLLKFKGHIESLHRDSFSGDDLFGKTLKKVLEDVLNGGGGEDDSILGGGGSGGGDPAADKLAASRRKKSYRAARNRVDGDGAADGGKRIAELLAKNVDANFRNAKSSIALGSSSNSASSMIALSGQGVRGGAGGGASVLSSDSDGDGYQNSIMDLFRLVHSKDVFEAFYRRDLAKRLLLQKSTSIDSERSFISKLKAECGGSYTSKMEGMFKDMDLSRDVTSNYAAYLTGIQASTANVDGEVLERRVDMDVTVLTTGYWPTYPLFRNLNLPSLLETQKDQFETYYKSKYQGRRIVWQNSLGNCIVRAYFPKITGVRELVVSLCQALVLLCFNVDNNDGSDGSQIEGYTILDIMNKTALNDRGEAERVLQSLSVGRTGTRVLSKIDCDESCNAGIQSNHNTTTQKKKTKKVRRTVSDKDIFIFNSDFTSNQHRVKIGNIQMKDTVDDRSKTHESVKLDRGYLIDAVIVRIMKARKTLNHRSLVCEVMNQLKFPANGPDIKKRIEGLIEREYVERSDEDSSLYKYVA